MKILPVTLLLVFAYLFWGLQEKICAKIEAVARDLGTMGRVFTLPYQDPIAGGSRPYRSRAGEGMLQPVRITLDVNEKYLFR